MTIKSMTGFARAAGAAAPHRWFWELKSVNSKGLDVRLRVPPGFDAIETEARAKIAGKLARGSCAATMSARREHAEPTVRINHAVLAALVEAVSAVPAPAGMRAPSMDALLQVRGVIDIVEPEDDEGLQARACAAALASLDEALDGLVAMREGEGAALAIVLARRLDAIAKGTTAADAAPGRKADAVHARLAQALAMLGAASPALDPARLHQEALLMAAKADIREELDRLATHTAACRALLAQGGPIGRRLDFLAQELGREANTLCAKSNDAGLTAIGLELRVEIEQFREQVQNIE